MQYRRAGRSGVMLPAISLGLWHNFGDVDTLSLSRKKLHYAFDHGITHFDLANNYGPSYGSAEETFGQIMKSSFAPYRDELFISTKAGHDMWPGPYGNWGSRKHLMASLEQSLKRMNLDYVDVFCDGTAVHIPGELTYPLCRELVDEFVTVTNNEVCQAIRAMWESSRVVPEPSGAMSLAGFLKQWNRGEVKPEEKSFVVISGANMDFTHLTQIARQAGIGNHETRYLRISMDSKRGQVLKYLRHIPQDTTLVDVQYGKTEGNTQHPVFGIAASDEDLDTIRTTLKKKGIEFEDISEDDDVRFRMIHYQPELCQHPLFVHIEFPERAGAFLDFMERIADLASLCYFNYTYTGERVGRALVGMEFDTAEDRETIRKRMGAFSKNIIRSIREISPEAFQRIMGSRQLTGNH